MEYRELFLSLANKMQTLLAGWSKKSSFRQIGRIGKIDNLPPGSQNIVKYFRVSLMRCKCWIENSTCRIVLKILDSPNRANRSNRRTSTRVSEYRETFLSVANGMQMSDRNFTCWMVQIISIRQIERVRQLKLLFFPIESS